VEYLDPSFIPIGSVEVESFFSVCSSVWGDRRLGTTPEHIESYMFLKTNQEFWDMGTVNEAIQALKGNEKDDREEEQSGENEENESVEK
jgi:hypothetical protein